MKKKILGGLLLLIITVVVALNAHLNSQVSKTSLLSLANVEALAESNEADKHKTVEKRVSTTTNTVEKRNGVTMDCTIIEVTCPGEGTTTCYASYYKNCIEKI